MDYGRGMPPRRDEDGGARRPMRMSDGPPPKKMKMGGEPMHRSPRGGSGAARRY